MAVVTVAVDAVVALFSLTMAVAVPLFQQLTGVIVIAFFSPVLFQTAGFGSDGAVLAEERQDPAGAGPDEGEGDAGEPDHHHGALLVDAEQVVLPRAERLAAEGVQRRRHAGDDVEAGGAGDGERF